MPVEFSSVTDALINFQAVFESRYFFKKHIIFIEIWSGIFASNHLPVWSLLGINHPYTEVNQIMELFIHLFMFYRRTFHRCRYGDRHPQFFIGNLADALSEAFEPTNGNIFERRPLALYIHTDRSIASNIFAKHVS